MDSEKRQRIIRAARDVFRQYGFKKTAIDKVAELADVAKGTVYLCAESKEELFYLALHLEMREWMHEMSTLIDPGQPADKLLWLTADAMIGSIEKRPLIKGFLAGEFFQYLSKWNQQLDELHTLGQQNIIEILKIGIRQGVFRADIDLENVAALIQDIRVATMLFYSHDGPKLQEKLERRFAASMSTLFYGISSGTQTLNVKPPRGFAARD